LFFRVGDVSQQQVNKIPFKRRTIVSHKNRRVKDDSTQPNPTQLTTIPKTANGSVEARHTGRLARRP
jgi:hypothetical protein